MGGPMNESMPVPRHAEHPSLADYLEQTLSTLERSRIGLISFNQWSFALGAVIETALTARSLGAEVTVGLWSGMTPLADTGWTSSRRLGTLLRSPTRDQRAKQILLAAGVPKSALADPPLKRWRPQALPQLSSPLTRSRIRGLKYRGSDMGRSILQVHPDANTPISEGHDWPQRWVSRAMRSYAWAYDQATALIQELSLTTVVVYNGRFTHDRAVAAAAEALGVRVLYYDTGGYETDFDLTDATTHDWAHLQERMLAMYESWPVQDRDAIAAQWFTDRQSRIDMANEVFVGIQQRGFLEGVPDTGLLVVYFSSSGDEIVELDLDWDRYLQSQENALLELAAVCRSHPEITLVVRTHPHMRLKPPRDLDDWLAAVERAQPAVHFDPYSQVDSYALMRAAQLVFTYGSTSGVEAAFMSKPVAVMGPSAYDLLGCARAVSNQSEIQRFLENPPGPQAERALPYGLMMQRRGFDFAFLHPSVSGELGRDGVNLVDSGPQVLKLSDAMKRLQAWWLTRK